MIETIDLEEETWGDYIDPDEISDDDPEDLSPPKKKPSVDQLTFFNVASFDLVAYIDMDTCREIKKEDTAGRTYCTYVDRLEGLQLIADELTEFIEAAPYIALDIETAHYDGRPFSRNEPPLWLTDVIGCFSISYNFRTYVIKLDKLCNPQNINIKNTRWLMALIMSKPIVGHNIKFDLRFIYRDYRMLPPLVFDTMLGAKVVECRKGLYFSLKEVANRFLAMTLSKDEQISNWGGILITARQIAYSARDTYILPMLLDKMVAEMNKVTKAFTLNKDSAYIKVFGVHNRVFHLEMELILLFTRIEDAGVHINMDEIQRIYNGLRLQESKLITDFHKASNTIINPRSSQQITQWVKENVGEMGYTQPDGRKKLLRDIPKVDHEELKAFTGKSIPGIDELYIYKTATGNIKRTTEFYQLMDKKTSRIFTSFKQWGAVSGRTSCPKPNLQNIKNNNSKDAPSIIHGINLKKFFTAPPDRALAVVDYSVIQLAIVAQISKDPVMIKTFNDNIPGQDLHIVTAAAITNKALADVTKEERKIAKPVNYGFVFGMGAEKFQDFAFKQYGIFFTLEECKKLQKKYFELYKGVKKWHYAVGDSERNGQYYTESLFGRRAIARGFTNATNYPVQATEADIVKIAMLLLDKRLQKEGVDAFIVNMIHDEIVCETSLADADYVLKIMDEEMCRAARMVIKDVMIRTEGHVVKCWADAK